MKKLLLIALMAVAAVSCKKEEAPKPAPTPTPKPCICEKQTWLRPQLVLPFQWRTNGTTEFYSNNCADNGRVLPGHTGLGYVFEYRIVCK
jgi:hypothetical protein